MNRWILLRSIGFGALTYFLLRCIDRHFNLNDMIAVVAILAGLAINEFFIRKRNSPK